MSRGHDGVGKPKNMVIYVIMWKIISKSVVSTFISGICNNMMISRKLRSFHNRLKGKKMVLYGFNVIFTNCPSPTGEGEGERRYYRASSLRRVGT